MTMWKYKNRSLVKMINGSIKQISMESGSEKRPYYWVYSVDKYGKSIGESRRIRQSEIECQWDDSLIPTPRFEKGLKLVRDFPNPWGSGMWKNIEVFLVGVFFDYAKTKLLYRFEERVAPGTYPEATMTCSLTEEEMEEIFGKP